MIILFWCNYSNVLQLKEADVVKFLLSGTLLLSGTHLCSNIAYFHNVTSLSLAYF